MLFGGNTYPILCWIATYAFTRQASTLAHRYCRITRSLDRTSVSNYVRKVQFPPPEKFCAYLGLTLPNRLFNTSTMALMQLAIHTMLQTSYLYRRPETVETLNFVV